MKTIYFKLFFFGGFGLLMACTPKSSAVLSSTTPATAVPEKTSSTVTITQATANSISSDILGEWDYTAFGTPLGDVPGKLNLKNENGVLIGTLTGNESTSPLSDLKADQNKITGHFYYSDIKIAITATFEGQSLVGEMSAGSEGSFKLTGKKVK